MFRASLTRRYLTRRYHPRADEVLQHTLAAPRARDPVAGLLEVISWGAFAVTYGIIVNWLYTGHLDLWDGTYGTEEDDDDD
jgi:hypothetical protein